MKARTTLILLALAVALGVWIKFFESKKPNTEESRRQAGQVLNFDREKLEGIVIQNGDDRIELRREKEKWRIAAPIHDQADNAEVDNLISDLDNWHKEAEISGQQIVADKTSLDEYGLTKPKLRLQLIGPGAPPEISFGKDAALGGQMYVRLGDSRDVILAAQTIKNDLTKKASDFRDRKLTSLAMAEVIRAVIRSPAGEIELARRNEHWDIVKPLQARGDDQKINDLIAQVTNARIDEFIADDRGDLHAYGLTEPRGSITLYAADDKQGQTLEIGNVAQKNKEQVNVRFLPRHGVYAVAKKTDEVLSVRPNDLRDHHLVRIDTNNLDRLTIEGAGQPKVVLARKDQTWSIASRNNQPANSDEVRRLISTLNEQQVTRFVADTASDLAKYGLDQPQLRLTFSSFASENTAESTAGEHPFLTLAFGKTEGADVYARIGEEPFIVAVSHDLLSKIWSDPLQWQELAIFKFKPGDVHRLSRVTDHDETVERTGTQDWQWVKGSGEIDKTNLQSLLNTLTSLRAVRWAGATTAAHGLDRPQLVVSFTTSPDDKAVHRLTLGQQTEDKMWFAKVDEREGTFILAEPDVRALQLPLLKSAQPAVSPTATTSPLPSAAASASP